MFETLINPRHASRRPWQMFFVGLLYAALSIVIADFVFLKNPIFEKHISIVIVFFTVMFSLPFFFYMIKQEETKDTKISGEKRLIKEHGKALSALLFLFLGYVVAFAVLYMAMPQSTTASNFNIQIETYCSINSPYDVEGCSAANMGVGGALTGTIALQGKMNRLSAILSNNFYVLLLSLVFSFIFGAGAIFVLAWNASVIAAAIGIFAKHPSALHQGLFRYMIHGIPEIAAYFVAALAGGIIGIAVIKHEFGHERFWHILQDSLDLIILSLVILFVAGLIEVFITPMLF